MNAAKDEGYQFVPLPERVHRAERPWAVHDRRLEGTLSGTIGVVLQAEQPVHVGSGFKRLIDDQKAVRRAALVRGRPGVPGSTLKGVLRSRYEAITYSCAGAAPKAGKVRSQTYRDVNFASFTREVKQKDVFRVCEVPRLCAACALFGLMSQRSRITVTDFAMEGVEGVLLDRLPAQFSPNAHHLGDFRVVENSSGKNEFEIFSLKGRKFATGSRPVADNAQWQPVEIIPKGARLRGQLRLCNLRAEELGGLLAALGVRPSSALKLGAGKGHGFGRMAVESLRFRLRDHACVEVVADEDLRASWRDAFENSPDRWATGEPSLAQIHGRSC